MMVQRGVSVERPNPCAAGQQDTRGEARAAQHHPSWTRWCFHKHPRHQCDTDKPGLAKVAFLFHVARASPATNLVPQATRPPFALTHFHLPSQEVQSGACPAALCRLMLGGVVLPFKGGAFLPSRKKPSHLRGCRAWAGDTSSLWSKDPPPALSASRTSVFWLAPAPAPSAAMTSVGACSLDPLLGGAAGSALVLLTPGPWHCAGLVYCPSWTSSVSRFTSKKIPSLPASSAVAAGT